MGTEQIVSIALFVMTTAVGIFAWLWNKSERNLENVIQNHSKDIESIKRDFADHRLHVATSYVTQSELAKTIGSFERTVERLLDAINQMSRDSKEAFAELHRRIDGKADK
jgi:hypothetical protein